MNTSRNLPDLSIKKIWGKLFRHDNDIEVLQERPVNNNILINSNFANPVNQRGNDFSDKGTHGYWIDRWFSDSNISTRIVDNCIEIYRETEVENISFLQIIEEPLLGKTVTFSAKLYGIDDIITVTGNIPTDIPTVNTKLFETTYINGLSLSILINTSGLVYVRFIVQKNTTVKLEWAKLELGEVATPYVPRPYQEEWLLCQRYYQIIDAGTSSCHGLNSNLIIFVVRPYIKMRAKGTPINNNLAVKKDNATLTGFTFSFALIDASIGFINIQASKTSHGVGVTNLPNLSGTFSVDAEL